MSSLAGGRKKAINQLNLINYDGPWDSWIRLIIGRKYETYVNIMKYDIEDYVHLFEYVLVEYANEMIVSESMNKMR